MRKAPAVRRIEVADLKEVLARGLDDFAACRTDVVFLCLVYPVLGLIMALCIPAIAWIENSALIIVLVIGTAAVIAAVIWWYWHRRSSDLG